MWNFREKRTVVAFRFGQGEEGGGRKSGNETRKRRRFPPFVSSSHGHGGWLHSSYNTVNAQGEHGRRGKRKTFFNDFARKKSKYFFPFLALTHV